MQKFFRLFLVFILLNCGSNKTAQPNIETIIDSQNFTITKPANWQPFIDHGYVSFTPLKNGDNKFNNSVSVFRYTLIDKPLTLKELAMGQMEQTITSRIIISQKALIIEDSRLGTIYTHEVVSTWNRDNYKKFVVYFEHDGDYYNYNYSSLKDTYDNHFEEAMTILESIEFK